MVKFSCCALDPFSLNQLCHFEAFYPVASATETYTEYGVNLKQTC